MQKWYRGYSWPIVLYFGATKRTQGGAIAPPNALAIPPGAGVHGAATAGCLRTVRRAGLDGVPAVNQCPAAYVRIESEAACRIAATISGISTLNVETDPTKPRGCYMVGIAPYNDMFFNKDPVGAGESTSRLVCAVAPAGASTGGTECTPSRRRMRVFVRSRLHNTEGALQSTLGTHVVSRVLPAGDTVVVCQRSVQRQRAARTRRTQR